MTRYTDFAFGEPGRIAAVKIDGIWYYPAGFKYVGTDIGPEPWTIAHRGSWNRLSEKNSMPIREIL